ncbi:MAG: glycoside hydrolase family 32 protein [Bacillota bacterium]|nr:glycoside hydrolase family 32 protein [Bacillota bacterium]
MSSILEQVILYEKEHAGLADSQRPLFHITGKIGWINDPNGFSVYKDMYHMFFQYHPYSTNWGPMHWGHVVSEDLLSWEYRDIALAPDQTYDKNGCFSGTAITLQSGEHALMYTSVNADGKQEQSLALGDGIHYKKFDKNPIICSQDVPQGNSTIDFRDPKIWKEDNRYYAVIGNKDENQKGCILLYQSQDLHHWEFVSTFYRNTENFGTMLECPDFFSLEDKDVLIVNPCSVKAIKDEFSSGHVSALFLGTWNRETNIFEKETCQNLDYGLDFYAPQTILDKKGRRILIGWMQNWNTAQFEHANKLLYGCLTLPRVLEKRGTRIVQNPIEEIRNYYHSDISLQTTMDGEVQLDEVRGRYFDLELSFLNQKNLVFSIQVAKGKDSYFLIEYSQNNNTLTIDRTYDGNVCDTIHVRKKVLYSHNEKTKLRVLVDRQCIEIFVNEGEDVFSNITYAPLEHDEISFITNQKIDVQLQFHILKK